MNKKCASKRLTYDLVSLFAIDHRCDPEICRNRASCCASYEICIDPDELDRIVAHLPHAARYAGHLRDGEGYRNVFDETDDGLIALDCDDIGLCVFAYRDADAHVLCSLHSVALDLGLPPYAIKPRSCALWPVSQVTGKPPTLSVDAEAHTFPCNTFADPPGETLCPAIRDNIASVLGDDTVDAIGSRTSDGKLKSR